MSIIRTLSKVKENMQNGAKNMTPSQLISERYKDLAAQLGDAYLKLKTLKNQIKTLEQQIHGLDQSVPLIQRASQKSDEPEGKTS